MYGKWGLKAISGFLRPCATVAIFLFCTSGPVSSQETEYILRDTQNQFHFLSGGPGGRWTEYVNNNSFNLSTRPSFQNSNMLQYDTASSVKLFVQYNADGTAAVYVSQNDGPWNLKFNASVEVVNRQLTQQQELARQQQQRFENFVDQVRNNYYSDEPWGQLGDAYQNQSDYTMANACWAVASLIDRYDDRWASHNPDWGQAIYAVKQLDIRDDEFAGFLGNNARYMGSIEPAMALYQLARQWDPQDDKWLAAIQELESTQSRSTGGERRAPAQVETRCCGTVMGMCSSIGSDCHCC